MSKQAYSTVLPKNALHDAPWEERFDQYVVHRPSGCWEWIGSCTPAGYGQLSVQGRRIGTHRLAYERYVGAIPLGRQVCHHCDNPPCCNPDHLFLGTASTNQLDAVQKGRQVGPPRHEGMDHHLAVLSFEQVSDIRRRYEAGGITMTALGREYGVSRTSVSHWVKNDWRRDA